MKKLIRMVLFLGCLGAFVISIWKLWGIYSTYQEGDEIYQQAVKEVVMVKGTMAPSKATDEPGDQEKKEEKNKEEMICVDFKKLQKINPQVVGWLYIPSSTINYPILQGEDNEKYLHQTYDGRQSIFGSIFIDCSNAGDFTDFHTIIYGHNMKNGSMFGGLKQYQNKSFFEKHRNIYILTSKATYRYRVFSYHVADAAGRVYQTQFSDQEEYKSFVELIKQSSYISTKVNVGEKDQTITLSTCTGKDTDRFVVHAKFMGEVLE